MSHDEKVAWATLVLFWFAFGVWPAVVDAAFAFKRGRREWRAYRAAVTESAPREG